MSRDTMTSSMRSLAYRIGARQTKRVRHTRKFPRVLAHCDACGRVHTFSVTKGSLIVGYSCGTKQVLR